MLLFDCCPEVFVAQKTPPRWRTNSVLHLLCSDEERLEFACATQMNKLPRIQDFWGRICCPKFGLRSSISKELRSFVAQIEFTKIPPARFMKNELRIEWISRDWYENWVFWLWGGQ